MLSYLSFVSKYFNFLLWKGRREGKLKDCVTQFLTSVQFSLKGWSEIFTSLFILQFQIPVYWYLQYIYFRTVRNRIGSVFKGLLDPDPLLDLVPAVPVLVKTFIFQTNQQEQGLILSVLSESESTTVFFSTQICVHRFPALFSPMKI